MKPGVSFVVPVHNGAACIHETIEAIFAQADGRPMEVIVVEDLSADGSSEVLRELAAVRPIRIIRGDGRGAAAAINLGVCAATHPIVCQVDQDVVIGDGWLRQLTAALDDPDVAAAQGCYVADREASWCARAMALDLEQRYERLAGRPTSHVCTGNTAYRRTALYAAGLFDERLGYGYDNDMSYRLQAAGYRLAFCPEARSLHRWRDGFAGYLTQQYGFGYGRIDLVAKHPRYLAGDSVSPPMMMAHPLIMAAALVALALGAVLQTTPAAASTAGFGAAALAAIAVERSAAGLRALRRTGDPAALLFPVLHLARDLAWVVAIFVWLTRRALKRPPRPAHSMKPRPIAPPPTVSADPIAPERVVGVIPAYNERANLAAVVAELRASEPTLDLIVVDDGSTDGTAGVAAHLGVKWLRFSERLGVGSAMRAGLRYAAALGYDAAVRIDGDGQHCAADVQRVLAPLRAAQADVALGSRYADGGGLENRRPLVKRALAILISALARRRVTDPTSGFCAIGPRALPVLAEHHPTGYAEPELQLFLSRNAFTVVEVPVSARPRLAGRTSLTAVRLPSAAARVVLAMLIVPLRCTVGGLARD
jgi:glycosyltransferase involved in cell wall biosynthesis